MKLNNKIIGIYKILNTKNSKVYIGSTKDFQKRKTSHINKLRKNSHPNSHLQGAWNAYGESAFCFCIIEQCKIEELITKETQHISDLKSYERDFGYNQKSPNDSRAGFSHSEETKRKISDSLSLIDMTHSAEIKEKISVAMKKVAKERNPESYRKMANTKKGKSIPKCFKSIYCPEINKTFESIKSAAEELGLQRTGISMVLNGTIKKTGGYSFSRVEI